MAGKPRVICAGLVTVDVFYDVEEYPREGGKWRARNARLALGGGAALAASTVARLGGEAVLLAAVGDDMFGAFIRTALADKGIDASHLVTVAGVASAHSAVLLSPGGERTVVNHRDARLFERPPPIPPFDAALMDTRWPDAMEGLLHAARKDGKPAVVDAEAPLAQVKPLLPLASHVAFSDQGLGDFAGQSGADGLAHAAKELGTWVCVTRGPAPVLVQHGSTRGEVPVQPVVAANTLGAGDVWHGAFTLSLAQGMPETEAIKQANAVAGAAVRDGAIG